MFKQEKNLNVQNEMVSTVQAQRYFEKKNYRNEFHACWKQRVRDFILAGTR